MKHEIIGNNLQMAKIELLPGDLTSKQTGTSGFCSVPSVPSPMRRSMLLGACAALHPTGKRAELVRVAKMMVYIDLLIDADFIDDDPAALYIPGKKEYFP